MTEAEKINAFEHNIVMASSSLDIDFSLSIPMRRCPRISLPADTRARSTI